MEKQLRHQKILELIRQERIGTQEELQERLALSGFGVTQATISRDIRRLQLTKVVMPDGNVRYVSPEDVPIPDAKADTRERFRRLFRESVTTMDMAGNIVVIHTLVGAAMGVAAALDSMALEHVLGSIAGDDTVFVLVRDQSQAQALLGMLGNIRAHPQ